MNNKKVFKEKVEPIKSIFTNYYGDTYSDKINHNFSTLLYNFDDIFASSSSTFDNSPNILYGLLDNYKNIKAKNLFNKLYQDHLELALYKIMKITGIDLHDKYDIFINQFFSLSKFETIIEDKSKLAVFAIKNNIDIDSLEEIINIFFTEKIVFYHDLLKIPYFKQLYKNVKKNYDLYLFFTEEILDRYPVVSKYKTTDSTSNYLYFPYVSLYEENNDLDTMLLHELIHLAESSSKDFNIGLNNGHNSFINEVRTDLLAKTFKKELKGNIFETRDIPYKSLYLRIAFPYLGFFHKYQKLLADIAIKEDLDRLEYYFTPKWNEFDKRMDELFIKTMQKVQFRDPGVDSVQVDYDLSIIPNLINEMEKEATTKILIK